MADEFCLKMPDFHVTFRDLLHAVNLRHEDFFALKNPTASAGFEPANVGTKGQHATSRPPKPPMYVCIYVRTYVYMYVCMNE